MAAFRITLQATSFGNTEGVRASIRSYLQTTLNLQVLLLDGYAPCSPTKRRATERNPVKHTQCF